jgi:iron complex transport system permease protein
MKKPHTNTDTNMNINSDITRLGKFRRWKQVIICLVVLLGVTIVLTTAIGPVYVPPLELLALVGSTLHLCETTSIPHEVIIFQVRLPRIILGLLVGISLATAGTTLQGLFKNPMADPYIIGIASGAAVGAAISITLLPSFFSMYTTPIIAFAGAMAAIFLVYNIARVGGQIPIDTLLLTGIAVSLFFSAILSFMMYRAGHDLAGIFFWLMGGFWKAKWTDVQITVLPVFVCFFLTYLFAKDLNILLLGEESAQTLGINVELVKRILLILSALITAAAVSFAGTM